VRLFSAKSLRGVYFVGKLCVNDTGSRGAIQLIESVGGFDREDDAYRAIEATKPEGDETHLIVRVVAEYRPRHTLLQVVPTDAP
jgi:hypothetical protein